MGKSIFLWKGHSIIIASFFKQFYSSTHFIPRQILVQIEPEELPELQNWLGSKRGSAVTIAVPSRGEKKKLIKMVEQNAVEALEQHRFKKLIDSGKTAAALVELQGRLKLTGLPNRIECYDISDVQGTSAVGSMVVFQEGQPKPSHYRRFKIKTITGNDDYAMMKEVLGRRFGSSSQSNSTDTARNTWAIVPDLVLIDGGKGHLNVAGEVISGLKLGISLASIAKGNEDIFIPGRSTPVPFESDSPALYLLQRIRDEAHRFAVSYHHRLRQRKVTVSALDTVPGVGPKRKKALLKTFGSVKRIREASVEELVLVDGINELLAKQIKEQV
ncbi:MAG: helix-hairpin-helix domain-containing protein [Chloroflexi bacterium]|nr:helix-hairpin-helix domain-containing protein [Chloroflexota bacterium]